MKVMNSDQVRLTDRNKMFHIQKCLTVFGVLSMRY
jgi:hypothetical protein